MLDSSGKPIRGKMDFFRPELDPRLNKINTFNSMDMFREFLKDSIALRMQTTILKPIKITKECLNIIENNDTTNNKYIFAFIKCTVEYYNDEKVHIAASVNKTCPSCLSRDNKKSVQHAKQDCIYTSRVYMKKVQNIINKKEKSKAKEIALQKYQAISQATKFFASYISSLLIEELPKTVDTKTIKKIKDNKYCDNLEEIYSYDVINDIYRMNKEKSVYYKSIDIRAATEIFCSKFKF